MKATYVALEQEQDGIKREIEITDQTTLLGRGKLLEINNKKVSRNHAILVLDSDRLSLKSTHLNPCFVNLTGRSKTLLLKKGGSVTLHDGDKFSLLQDCFSFKVIIRPACDEKIIFQQNKNNHSQSNGHQDSVKNVNDFAKAEDENITPVNKNFNVMCANTLEETSTKETNSPKKLVKIQPVRQKRSTASSSEECGDSPKKRRILPSWMSATGTLPSKKLLEKQKSHASGNNSAVHKTQSTCHSKSERTKIINQQSDDDTKNSDNDQSESKVSSTSKIKEDIVKCDRLLSVDSHVDEWFDPSLGGNVMNNSDNEDKVLMKDASISVAQNNTNLPELNSPGSNAKSDSSLTPPQNEEEEKVSELLSPIKEVSSQHSMQSSDPATSKREICVYGKSCYRKNPVHLQEFSHPGDSDYMSPPSSDDENKPECEYGLQCYRKNPLHRKQFKHTRRVTPKRANVKKPKRDDESCEDDYDLEDSFIDDDDEIEEDIESEESDWEPSQDKEKKSRTHNDDEDDDDIDELLLNAKKFTKNKKLWKN
ncbi:unnamed protein product [Clavelina lepadiformis]|uniref:Aprataxin and PNK-like factor n=1 Tax=Clavelina lepadiformis TaxID=159417 RepID=A0ABP0FA10_CLALP